MPLTMADVYGQQYVFECDPRILRGDPKGRNHVVHILTENRGLQTVSDYTFRFFPTFQPALRILRSRIAA